MNARALTVFFVKRPIIFWSFVVGVLFMGVFSYNNMPKLEDPAVAVKQASVVSNIRLISKIRVRTDPQKRWDSPSRNSLLATL